MLSQKTIILMGLPSKLQTKIALSTVEAEYKALSQGLREVLAMMSLVDEAKVRGVPILSDPKATVKCKAFEDNTGALELSTVPKMRPRTKHINIKFHHFRAAVKDEIITIERVCTENQKADIYTKPLCAALFIKHRFGIMGW